MIYLKGSRGFDIHSAWLGMQVDRLEGRKSVFASGELVAHSATVKKDDGKWKVDTSYIGLDLSGALDLSWVHM